MVEMPKGGPAASSEPPGLLGWDVPPERSSLPFRRGLRSDMAIIRTCPGLPPPPDQSAFENMAPQEKPVSENPVYQDLAFPVGTKAIISVSISNPGYRLTWGTGFHQV